MKSLSNDLLELMQSHSFKHLLSIIKAPGCSKVQMFRVSKNVLKQVRSSELTGKTDL